MGIFSRMLHHLKGESIDRSFSKAQHDVLMTQLQQQTCLLKLQENRQVIECLLPDSNDDPIDNSLCIDLPYQADYQPRRIEPRIEFNDQSVFSANINPLFGAPWYAKLKNISQGGMRIAVAGDLRDQLHKNLPIQRCDIDLGFKKPLRCSGRVKSFSFYTRPYRHTLVSIMFENMNEHDLGNLEDFLMDVMEAA